MTSDALRCAWPLFGLSIAHEGLRLVYPDDDLVVHIGEIVAGGLLDAHERHFMPRLMESASADRATTLRNVLGYYWRMRAAITPDTWTLPMAVVLDGEVVGAQTLRASSFPVMRDVHTGSFLARTVRGRGVGTRMRALALELAFAYLTADSVSSGYADGNAASARVSSRLGYLPDGIDLEQFEGRRIAVNRLRLTGDRWTGHRPAWLNEVTVTGLDDTRQLLGLMA